MRIALVSMYSDPFSDHRACGMTTAASRLASDRDVALVAFGKRRAGHVAGYGYVDKVSDLNGKFDLLIFDAPGTISKTPRPLDGLRVPFAVQSHGEGDERTFAAQAGAFFSHRCFRSFLPICPALWSSMPAVETYPWLAHRPRIAIRKRRKERLVASSCRITSSKRVAEFVRQAPALRWAGYRTEVHGGKASFFYFRDLPGGPWEYRGPYGPADLDAVLSPVLAHWNCRCYRRGTPFASRLEIASIEAVERGCIPIVHGPSTPPELRPLCLSVDSLDPALDLAGELESFRWWPRRFEEAFNDLYRDKDERLMEYLGSLA